MDRKEYHERLAQIERNYKMAKSALAAECAKSNNPYQGGDIITNGSGTIIIVEKIEWQYGYGDGLPYCVYSGTALKKDLTPRKVRPFRDTIYQSDKIQKLN